MGQTQLHEILSHLIGGDTHVNHFIGYIWIPIYANIETTLVGDSYTLEMSIIDKRIGAKEAQLNRLEDRVANLDNIIATARPQDRNYIDRRQRDERIEIANDIDIIVDDIVKLNEDKLPLERKQLEQEGEIGPIKYVAEVIYGQDESVKYLDNAVRWVIFALIFVFDPLAILLLITSAGIIQRRAREEKPQVVENRYVLQIPKEKMDSIKKPS